MLDARLKRLAEILVNFSIAAKRGEKVLIQATNAEAPFVNALVDTVHAAGALPFVSLRDKTVEGALIRGCSVEQMEAQARYELARMKEMDCFIGFTAPRNISAWSGIPSDKMELYNNILVRKVHMEQRVPRTRWVVLRYPTPAMAQLAGMSEEAFEEFYFSVCTLDYEKLSKAMDPLAELLARTDGVRIVSPGTDLSFSIKGLSPVKCDGRMNIPDGEVYTAPVRDSVNGVLSYNTPSERDGFTFENVRLEFRDGKIVKASANDSARLNTILDTDPGARYVGEFAFGVNPYITRAMKETLFDEKIAGSIHFTPGNSYDDCFNGNRSAVHWDMVLIQTPEHGGGEIWLDGRLVRKDGRFVVPELEGLNPENLKS